MRSDRQLTVRGIAPEDLERVFTFGGLYCRDAVAWPVHWDADSVASVLARGFEYSYLAEVKGNLVGILIAEPSALAHDPLLIEMRWMAVNPELDDSIAVALMEALREGASALGASAIRAVLPCESSLCGVLLDDLGFACSATLSVMEKKIAE